MAQHALKQSSNKITAPHWPLLLILILTLLLETLGGVICFRRYGLSAFSIYLLVAAGLLIMVLYSWNTFFNHPKMSLIGLTSPSLLVKVVLFDSVCAVLLEAGTLIGALTFSPLRLEDWHVGRVGVFFFAMLVVSLLAVEYVPVREKSSHKLTIGVSDPQLAKSMLFRFAILLLVGVMVIFLARVISLSTGISWLSLATLFLAIAIIVLAILSIARDISWKPERIFACVSLAVGLALIVPFPATNLNSWDDEVHFRNANALSYITNVEQSSSTRMMEIIYALEPGFSQDAAFGRYWQGANSWSEKQISEFSHELDQNNVAETTSVETGLSYILMQFSFIGYIPSAIALWIARLLHLPFTISYALGRTANLVSYTFICFMAIRTIPCKKTLLSAVALLPTNVFLAANYSYDAWLTSWLLLAVALIIKELKSKRVFTTSRWSALLLIFLFALGPKAIYFPLIALLMLFPKQKYASRQQKKIFYIGAIIVALLVVATFALSFLGTSGGSGDSRGGTDVSGIGQVAFIVSNPLSFAHILINFIFGSYLTMPSYAFAFSAYAYLGSPTDLYPMSTYLLVALLVVLSLIEGTETDNLVRRFRQSLWTLFLCLVVVVLSCSALYISFTAVGSDTVAGMQPRYLLPLVFPFCALTLNVPHTWRLNEKALSAVTLSASSSYLVFYTWFLFTSRIVV